MNKVHLSALLGVMIFACASNDGAQRQEWDDGSDAPLVDANEGLEDGTPGDNTGSGSGAVPGEALTVTGHYMVGATSKAPSFPVIGTAWRLFEADRRDIAFYLDSRKAKGYTTIVGTLGNRENAYGDTAWRSRADGKPDVSRPNITTGSDFANVAQYDYWDHMIWVLGELKARNMNAVMALGASYGISGGYSGATDSVFIETPELAYRYGHYVGTRLRDFAPNLIFSVLDDRAAVYGARDRRSHYRALAEGIADGVNNVENFDGSADYSTTLLTALPRKADPSSSAWFHGDPWIDINGIQAWPNDGRSRVAGDFAQTPTKPSLVIEGRYENYNDAWKAWSQRYQAYIPTFAGAMGVSYGEELVCIFSDGWRNRINAPGAGQVPYIATLMAQWSKEQFLSRIPDQSLVANSGTLNNTSVGGTYQAATRSRDRKMAMVYAMNGRTITVVMSKLAAGTMRAYWFNPQTGKWRKNNAESATRTPELAFTSTLSGTAAPNATFDPPGSAGADNDWVLLLEAESS